MKSGDLVRFKHGYLDDQWKIGLLLEYEKWQKVGTVLYNGSLLRLRGERMQKSGKRDENSE